MTPVEERLSALLHEAMPDSNGVNFDAVARRARRRRVLATASATAVAAVVAGSAIVVAAMPGGGPDRVATRPTPTSSGAPRSVTFEGITFALPAGWTVAQGHCGPPANHTVVIGVWTGSCPGPAATAPTTAAELTAVYGRQFALSWPGRRTTWQGQPAWLAEQTTGRLTMFTLSLPWANAVVTAQSGEPAMARALLNRVSATAAGGLEVPQDASSIFVQSMAGHDGDGQQRNAAVTNHADIQRLLADLRAMSPVTSPRQACDGLWLPHTALLTVHSGGKDRTYAARFDRCDLVIAGTGSAARASHRLLADIKQLVANSGL